MSQRKSSPLRASVLVLAIAVVLFGVAPNHATAQAARPAAQAPVTSEAPTTPAQPAPLSTVKAAVRAAPPAPTAPPCPGNSAHARVRINSQNLNAIDGTEDLCAPKSRQHERQAIDGKQQNPGRQQWIMGERLRVANEAARREADRMINAASPMDWRNRYSSE